MFFQKLSKIISPLFYKANMKKIHGFYFTMQPNTSEITKGESIQVYQGPEWEELNALLNEKNYFKIVPRSEEDVELMYNTWEHAVMNSSFKKKYFSLIPFCVEDRQTQQAKKKFILNMELFPDSKHIKFQCSMLSGKNILNDK